MQMTAVATAAKAETPKADPTLIDDNVDGVMFRFALEYRNQISPALWLKETLAICGGSKKPEPAQQQQSQLFIEPTLNVGTYAFFHELCDAGFVMTRVSPQEWVDKRRGPCFAVRFIFNRTPLQYAVEPTLQKVIGVEDVCLPQRSADGGEIRHKRQLCQLNPVQQAPAGTGEILASSRQSHRARVIIS